MLIICLQWARDMLQKSKWAGHFFQGCMTSCTIVTPAHETTAFPSFVAVNSHFQFRISPFAYYQVRRSCTWSREAEVSSSSSSSPLRFYANLSILGLIRNCGLRQFSGSYLYFKPFLSGQTSHSSIGRGIEQLPAWLAWGVPLLHKPTT
jgi:hypothetical protein